MFEKNKKKKMKTRFDDDCYDYGTYVMTAENAGFDIGENDTPEETASHIKFITGQKKSFDYASVGDYAETAYLFQFADKWAKDRRQEIDEDNDWERTKKWLEVHYAD